MSPGSAGRADMLTSQERALAVRSPTAELERALRDQLDYSHTLDEDIMEQVTLRWCNVVACVVGSACPRGARGTRTC